MTDFLFCSGTWGNFDKTFSSDELVIYFHQDDGIDAGRAQTSKLQQKTPRTSEILTACYQSDIIFLARKK